MTCQNKRRDSGMTLVEVLTVLVIIALMTSAVVLSRPKMQAPEKTLSDKLLLQLNSAAQDSMISGRPHGLALSGETYVIYTLDGEMWEEVVRQDWPAGISVRLIRDGQPVKLPEELSESPNAQIIFDPTGISTAFQLTFNGQQKAVIISSTGNGRVTREARQ